MKKNYLSYILLICALNFGFGQTTIAVQDFETVPATPTLNYSFNTGSFDSVSGNSGTGDSPQNSPMYTSSNTSWRVRNSSIDADFGPIDITSYQSVQVEFNLAGFSIGSTGNGLDGGDYVDVYISLDNGASWSYEMEITGDSNAKWAFNSGSNRTITYDGDNNPNSYSSTNTNPIDNVVINIPNSDASSASNFLVGFVIYNNSSNETWNIDDIQISGISSSPCASPTAQPTGLTLSNITGSSIDGSFTAASADEYLVVASTSPTLGANPVDTTTYTNGDSLGSGVVVQSSSATTFTATGLTQNTPYYFYIFSLNGSGCSGGPLYYTTNPLTGNATTISGPCASTGFESGEPTGWSNNGSYYNGGTSNTGTQKAGMNSNNDWISTDQLSNPSDISFWARTSSATSDYTITIQYSLDGTTWFDHTQFFANGSNTGDLTTTYQQFNINLNLTGNYYIRWYISDRTGTGGSFYLDDVEVYCGTSTPEPELQLVDNTSTNQSCGYSIDFGSVANDGSTSDLAFDITNIGSLDLNVSSFNITGDYTIISPATPFVVAPNDSQTITIRFAPTTEGTLIGVLTINNDDSDEGSCTINLTGIGFTPAPDINVEGNLGAYPDIAGDASNVPAGFNNTLYAARPIGTSEAKAFRIGNEGSLNLNISNISIGGSNPGDFTISGATPAYTIAPNGIEILEITFSPLASGTRTATIIIESNDSDEDPFVFNIQGTGECTNATYTLSPSEGPAGTIVTVTTITGSNPNSFTALYSGSSTTVTNISASTFEITIPSNAISSDITFDDMTGCSRNLAFTVIDEEITTCQGTGTLPGDIFISEVTDRDSSVDGHSYVELFNGTGADVDISDYFIEVHSNGNSGPSGYINIPNGTTLANGDTYVISFGTGTNNVDPVSANDYFSSGTIGINDNDYLILNNGFTDIDLWGDTSGNPFTGGVGTEYNSPNPNGSDYDYRREIIGPSLTWNPSDWLLITPVNYSDIGIYNFSVGTPPIVNSIWSTTTACNEVTISVSATEGYVTGNPLAYYWYAYDPANAGLGWQAISNGGIYTTNTTSPNLVISDPNSVLDFQFYCQVREDDATCFTASNAIKITYGTATWDGTNWTWNDGTAIDTMPTTNASVIIDGDYDTSSGGVQTSFEACDCTVNTGNTLTIENNTYVLVENDLTVDGNVIVKTDGSFVQVNDNANVDGAVLSDKTRISVEKETAYLASYHEYTYWSSPVNGEIVSDGLEEANDNRIYYFSGQNFRDSTAETSNNNATVAGQDDIDDDANDWLFANGATVMLPGVGYASTHDPSTFINPTSYSYTFEGAFNNGIFNVPIYRNDAETNDNNWNFIGNPYPSAIDADLFLAANSSIDQTVGATNGAIFFWSHNTAADGNTNGNENLNYAQSDYAIINGSGETMGGDRVMPNRYIPSGQGFFVSMDDGATASVHSGTIMTTNVVFNNSMRVTGNNDQFFRTAQYNKLWLNLTSDNGIFNQVLVAYVDGATDGDDGMYYDAHKNLSSDLYSGIYTIIDSTIDKKFAIQGKDPYNLNIDEVIPLGFSTTIEEATIYTISIHATEGNFMGENDIFVIDYDLNIIHNLKTSDYNFTSNSGEFNNRFEIVFTPQALSINDNVITANDLIITELNNGEVQIKVSEQYTIQHVEILDVLGRQVYSLTGNNSVEVYNLSKLSNAAYIAKVTLSNGQVISKKAIKQR